MPYREYYDRDAPKPGEKIVNPSRSAQAAYDYLRSQRSQAIQRNWTAIREAFPEVAGADDHLQRLLADNPNTPFAICRPEDILFTDQAGSPVFLR